jgi:hypothetical protein
MLASLVHAHSIDVFVSTLYTIPNPALVLPHRVAVVIMLHDFIPERFGWSSSESILQKPRAVATAGTLVTVSQHTTNDLCVFYEWVCEEVRNRYRQLSLVSPRVDTQVFRPASEGNIRTLRSRLSADISDNQARQQIEHAPYMLWVGGRRGYKNALLLVRAMSLNPASSCTHLEYVHLHVWCTN